jgi:hypothetical protein
MLKRRQEKKDHPPGKSSAENLPGKPWITNPLQRGRKFLAEDENFPPVLLTLDAPKNLD